MKRGYAALAVVGIAAAVMVLTLNSAALSRLSLTQNSGGDSAFIEYLARFGKSYENLREYEMRKAIFEEALKNISEHNAKENETWQMGLNLFSDMLPHEVD